jgi:hypothetical protein
MDEARRVSDWEIANQISSCKKEEQPGAHLPIQLVSPAREPAVAASGNGTHQDPKPIRDNRSE